MQSEQQPTPTVDNEPQVTHTYYEVGGEILSKPNALCDIVEQQKGSTTVIFCNSPSDADLAEVMLKKRGVNVRKLVGHVPPLKVHEAKQALINRQISALVVTDVSARGLELHNLNLVLNYSLPDDPEIYLHRAAVHIKPPADSPEAAAEATVSRAIASLISPLDIGNFHYLKKISNLQFTRMELPSAADLLGIRVEAVRKAAEAKAVLHDPRYQSAVELLLKSVDKEQVIAFLLYNTLEVIPSLTSSNSERAPASAERREHSEGGDDDRRDSRGPARGGRGDGRDRRDGRGGDRGGRNGRGGRDRGGRRFDDRAESEGGNGGQGFSDQGNEEGVSGGQGYDDRARGDDFGGGRRERGDRGDRYDDRGGEEGGRRGRNGMRNSTPPARDYRIYLGQGSTAGLKEQEIRALVTEKCQLAPDEIKRVVIRDLYAFVDVPEEKADAVCEQLGVGKHADGSPIFARKAVTISVPRPAESGAAGDEEGGSNEGNEGSGDFAAEGSADDAPQNERNGDQGDWQS